MNLNVYRNSLVAAAPSSSAAAPYGEGAPSDGCHAPRLVGPSLRGGNISERDGKRIYNYP